LVGYGTPFNESEMALWFERMLLCAQKVLDTADIVREAMLQQLVAHPPTGEFPAKHEAAHSPKVTTVFSA